MFEVESSQTDQKLVDLALEKHQVNEYFLEIIFENRDLTSLRYFKTPMNIFIIVGPTQVSWRLPADLLCDKLPGFTPTVQASLRESNALSIHLKKEDPAVFATVVDWLLSGNLDCHKSHELADSNESHHSLHWYKVHAFAERYYSAKLCNAAISRTRLCLLLSESLPNPAEIQDMFSQDPTNQRFQNLIVTEVVNAFLSLSMDDVRKGMSELIDTISSHPTFHALFLVAVKTRYESQTLKPIDVRRKRSRAPSAVPATSYQTSQQTIVDLTED
jgi:hypothetical protein